MLLKYTALCQYLPTRFQKHEIYFENTHFSANTYVSTKTTFITLQRGAFCQFSFRWICLTAIVVNAPERKLSKCTFVHCLNLHLKIWPNEEALLLIMVSNLKKKKKMQKKLWKSKKGPVGGFWNNPIYPFLTTWMEP